MARQPEAAGSMFAPMIVTAAMIEGAMLFAIAVALMSVLGLLP
jgi:F0F1-type ATP synthase membrane subunit c/vacuolar-type H+-ATPase subunit K